MLKIGDFAQLALVSVQTLRYYDQLGLLKPELVDDTNGYRYYAVEQLPTLHHILALKDLGLSLSRIRDLLAEGITEENVRGMLRLKRAELEAEIQVRQEQLLRVEARLSVVREHMPRHDVALKSIAEQTVAVAQGDLDIFDAINTLFARVDLHLETYGAKPVKSCLASFPDPWQRARNATPFDNVEVATPIRFTIPDGDHVSCRALPAVPLAACAIHQGPYDTLPSAYATLLDWCYQHGYRVVGPSREVYLRFSEIAVLYPEVYLTKARDEFITEVQLPVEKIYDA